MMMILNKQEDYQSEFKDVAVALCSMCSVCTKSSVCCKVGVENGYTRHMLMVTPAELSARRHHTRKEPHFKRSAL